MKTIVRIQFAVVITTILLASQVRAQDIEIKAGVGYGWAAIPEVTGYNRTIIDLDDNYSFDMEYVKGSGSFGRGLQAGISIGYMFTGNLGAELGIGYLAGKEFEYKYYSTSEEYGVVNSKSTLKGSMIRLVPAVKISAGDKKIKPYLKTGLVIGIAGKIKATYIEDNLLQTGNNNSQREYKYSGGVSIGFSCSLGADYSLNDKIGIFAEIGIIAQSWAPKKGEVTQYEVNGEDQLSTLSTYFKETEFVDNPHYQSPIDVESTPKQELKTYHPFSSVGINVGIRYSFGGAK